MTSETTAVVISNSDYEDGIRKHRVWLANRLIDRDPAIEVTFRNLTRETIGAFIKDKPYGEIIAEYWKEICDSGLEYESSLRAFKAKYSLDRMIYRPEEDGITHINVYSKGATVLGRSLSNFGKSQFEHPTDGVFASVEAYWYWLSLGSCHDELRSLYGFHAKQAGKAIREEIDKNGQLPTVENFEAKIKKAILCKIEQNSEIADALKLTTLPLVHYYAWGESPNIKITVPTKFAWIHNYISDVRDYLNGKAHKLIVAGSRDITSYDAVRDAYVESGFKAIEIVSGRARGVDRLGERLAQELNIPVAPFVADWDAYKGAKGNPAGFIRNDEMVKYGSAGLLIWDGVSNGTRDTKNRLEKANKPFYLKTVF